MAASATTTVTSQLLLKQAIHPQAERTEHNKPADNGILKNLTVRTSVKPVLTYGREILDA